MGKILVIVILLCVWPWQHDYLQVLDAASQTFIPGRKESPTGVRYNLLVRVRKSSYKMDVDQIWIKQRIYPVHLTTYPGKKETKTFSRGDTLLIRLTVFESDTLNKDNPNNVILPSDYKSEVVIGYLVHEKRKFIEVKHIRRLPEEINL